MNENLKVWNAVKQPPTTALKTIQGGRLKGKTDINPQWRYQAMTEQFGMCGVGWKYEVEELWTEKVALEEVIGFAKIILFVREDDGWSDGIPGVGGSMLVAKESGGLHNSDEVYKMAITDALSVAMKMLGVAADIYAGLFDGAKYKQTESDTKPKKNTEITIKQIVDKATEKGYVVDGDVSRIKAIMVRVFSVSESQDLNQEQRAELLKLMDEGKFKEE